MKKFVLVVSAFVSFTLSVPASAELAEEEGPKDKLWFLSAIASSQFQESKFSSSVHMRFMTKDRCLIAARSFESNQIRRMTFLCGDKLSCEAVSASCTNLESGRFEVVVDCMKYKKRKDGNVVCYINRVEE